MRIDYNGNVGLGTTTPMARLTIAAPNWNNPMAKWLFVISSSTGSTATTTIFSVDNVGNVVAANSAGIGTTTPAASLGVQGNQFIAGNITSTSTIASLFPYASTTGISSSNSSYFATVSGAVGIGTTTPISKLAIDEGTPASGYTGGIDMYDNVQGSVGSLMIRYSMPNSTANASGYMGLERTGATVNLGMVFRSQSRDGIRWLTGATSPVEVMRLTAAGNLGIGTTSPFALLSVHAASTTNNQYIFAIGTSTSYGTQNAFLIDKNGSTTIALFGACSGANALQTSAAGLIQCGAVSSDLRLKEDIQPIASALDDLMRLSPDNFHYKPEASMGSQEEAGFIAQEVQRIFPDAVETMRPTALTHRMARSRSKSRTSLPTPSEPSRSSRHR
jgi:hypothetical protein